jgi:hypothetical protein
MRSFIVKMRLTDIREYFVEAKNAEEAAANAESGEAFMHDFAHCHTAIGKCAR